MTTRRDGWQWTAGVSWGLVVVLSTFVGGSAVAHEGPDPVAHWYFTPNTVQAGTVKARLGPDAEIIGQPRLETDSHGSALRLDGVQDRLLVATDVRKLAGRLPDKLLTVAIWATVDQVRDGAGLISAMQVHAEGQKGWSLGYGQRGFRFALASLGSDDGNGRMTVLESGTPIEPKRYYRIVATYDGSEMRLYVNGEQVASSRDQSGPILYGARTSCVIGAAADTDELICHDGLLRDVRIYDIVATQAWVTHDYEDGNELVRQGDPSVADDELVFVVTPYLQRATQDGMTVMWETNRPAKGRVRFGLDGSTPQTVDGNEATIHEIRLGGLDVETPYYYRVEATDDRGRKIESPLLSFQTANRPETPFAFGVIGDTQYNPRVSKALSDMLWMQRPHFVVVAGDLVDDGPNKSQWTEQFFPGMNPLISRVSLFPVIGNHEQNTHFYYDYMSLPEPEYYYTFHYGNAQFFMLDSNKEVGPGSEQWEWLEKELAKSTAEWKFVAYHHPSYSSDEDDYGDMWRGRSKYGDQRLRPLSQLYDKYGVDIVWNGHIHSYERTWPLKDDKVVEDAGTIYLVTGGGGGGLETAGPIKPYFQNNVKHGHHYCLVGVNGRTLEFKAFDLEGRLFDYLKIDKRTRAAGPTTVLATEPASPQKP
ncbi:MAG: LamG-like jellyroll fold domain-containing protein [Pirellulales bacterium]